MGLVGKRSTLALVAFVVAAMSCRDEQSAEACDVFCSDLERCRLLPSPLGFGNTSKARQQNCIDRCNESHSPPGKPAECGRDPGDPPPAWCAEGCAELAACINNDFPSGEATGTGQVILQVRIDPSASWVRDACFKGSMTDPMPSGASDACKQVALDQVFVITPGAPAMTGSPFDKPCRDAISVPFPALTTRAGPFKASLKLMGHTTAPGGGEGEPTAGGGARSASMGQPGTGGTLNTGLGGTLAANDAGVGATVCRVMPLGGHNALAGMPTAIYATVPGNWASDPALVACESSCFDGNDEDQDGRTDCDDPACAEKCQACTHVVKDGGAVPDCTDPDCACVVADGMGGSSGSVATADIAGTSAANAGPAAAGGSPTKAAGGGEAGGADGGNGGQGGA